MLTCPMCKKTVAGLERRCRTCQTDLSLLVDYVEGLDTGLARAEALTRAGQLSDAVWAYLEVLEVDPDNATARRQVGQVAAAVRQFDHAAPGRRWRRLLQKATRFRRMVHGWESGEGLPGWLFGVAAVIVLAAALGIGYGLGYSHASHQGHAAEAPAPAAPP
jgi:hypothetical protein